MKSLAEIQQQAAAKFKRYGLPAEKSEDWLYTHFSLPPNLNQAAPVVAYESEADIVLVNGFLLKGNLYSLKAMPPATISKILNFYESEPYDGFAHWNLSQANAIWVTQNTGYVELHHHMTAGDQVAHPRLVVMIPENQKTALYLRLTGEAGNSLTNLHLLILAEKNSHLSLVLEYNLHPTNSAVVTLQANLASAAQVQINDLHLSGKTTRLTFQGNLSETKAHLTLNGLLLGYGSRHSDATTLVQHLAERTTSQQTYYSILNHSSSSAFTGRIYVQHKAQHIEAQQLNRSLLLSDTAQTFSRPQLEINADDVKCSHGASVGQLDLTALFYLRSRGIAELEAKQILLLAFAQEIIDGILADKLRNKAQENVFTYLKEVVSYGG